MTRFPNSKREKIIHYATIAFLILGVIAIVAGIVYAYLVGILNDPSTYR